jgi:hypothetical protein
MNLFFLVFLEILTEFTVFAHLSHSAFFPRPFELRPLAPLQFFLILICGHRFAFSQTVGVPDEIIILH